ncbi:MAG: carbohydrate porin [Planctomycetia bacterium]
MCLYWNFDQFLFVDPADSTRGFGPFGRAGIADASTSPIDAFLSFGPGATRWAARGATTRSASAGTGRRRAPGSGR